MTICKVGYLEFSICGINAEVVCRRRCHHVGCYRLPLLNIPETIYIIGLLPLEIHCQIIHPLLGLDQLLPYLPLMLTSAYCAVGLTYAWLKAHYIMFTAAS